MLEQKWYRKPLVAHDTHSAGEIETAYSLASQKRPKVRS
jgi:hypothetical protein